MKHKGTIEQFGNLYALHTARTSYLFRVMLSGQLEHLHYGAAVACSNHTEHALAAKPAFAPGCSVQYAPHFAETCLEQTRTEVGTAGKGDIGEPLITARFADGNSTLDFVFVSAAPCDKPSLNGLPSAYGADATLAVTLAEAQNPALTLTLYYSVFVASDVITRTAVLHNGMGEALTLDRFGSSQLDFNDTDYIFSSFHGGWSDEMHRCDTRLNGGTALAESRGGTSSNHTNPFTMLSRPGTTETAGEVYGSNLIYSSNHRTIAQIGGYGKLRLQTGISPEGFAFTLQSGECFTAPEAVLSFSTDGYDGLSQNMHQFVRNHVVRGKWQHAQRPVLLNSWEACYMDFNEAKLLKLAKAGKACGVELFVLDDGWFGTRSDDHQSLGDWYVNTKKLPKGLKGLAEKINKLDMHFGVWVEPEMLNVDSDLYRAHPDWALCHPSRPHSEGRNQRILDLTNPAVRDYLKTTLSDIFGGANIAYVKWDMNRVISDAFSQHLPAAQQGELAHRYMLGLYDILAHLTATFPDILFESCASGGNRADLGMLCYMPQVWASDNTDAVSRARIQTGYSFGYPMSALGCHVSCCPNHQTLRETPLETRFNVALCGMLGYELDFTALPASEKKEIAEQIALYKTLRPWLQYASYHRMQNGDATPPTAGLATVQRHSGVPMLPHYQWCAVSADKTKAIGVDFQLLHSMENAPERFCMRGLMPETEYEFYNVPHKVDIRPFGSMINQVSPIPIKQGGLLHQVAAKLVMLDGEVEHCIISGSALAACGASITSGFTGTGFNEKVKYMPDFGSRLYFAAALPEEAEEPTAEIAPTVPQEAPQPEAPQPEAPQPEAAQPEAPEQAEYAEKAEKSE